MSAGTTRPEPGHFGRFQVLVAERRLLVEGRPVALGSRAFDLLAALVARRDRVVPKDELIEVVWPCLVVEDNNLQVQISALRKILGAQAIATVPGRGYQFTLAALPPNAAVVAPLPPAGATPRVSRLLVADDNKVNRLLLCRSLELMGHSVASADNGRTALDKLRSERFDLLLLDLEMPEVDGFGLLEQRAADPTLRDVPVIVTSSLEGAAPVARCIELGADDYLHKPVNPVLLKARVGSSLERKHWRDRERELLARLAPGMSNGVPPAGARRVDATLLVAHLHDIDTLAITQPAQDTLDLLGNWSTLMLDAVEGHGGWVRQMAGDTLTALFEHEPSAAVQAALEMLELATMFNAERSASGRPAVVQHIGIASGTLLTGHAGTPRRAAPVWVGAVVQRADRLAALAAERSASVLIDTTTRAALAGGVATDTLPAAVLPGSASAVTLYALRAD
ncbi:MAG: response regulator [Burkholderiales bacterium]|nr:response regulator [Burkholderiales bacterium]